MSDSDYKLIINLDGLPKMTNQLGRMHWRKKSKEANGWKDTIKYHCFRKEPIEPLKKVRIVCTRFSAKEPDYDGLVSGFKHCLDGLKLAKIIFDDKPSVIVHSQYKWVKTSPSCGKIRIEVYAHNEKEG